MDIPSLFAELVKIGAISDERAERALARYETLERNKPTVGQVARYGAIGAVAAPAIGAVGDVIAGKGFEAGKRLRGHLGRAVGGALTSGAVPIARAHLDRRAEMGTLKKYLHEHDVDSAHRGPPTAGKLSAPFEPVEKAAAAFGRALRMLTGELDTRVLQQIQQEGFERAGSRLRGKEKDSGTGITPARGWNAEGYTVDLVKGAFATSAYSGGPGYPSSPQKSFQPGFRAPSLQRVAQSQPQQIVEKLGFKLQGHTEHQGIPIAIENRKGSVRKGVDKDGKPWRTEMKHPYGYIKGTKGADGEEVDAYVGPVKDATHAHVVHQRKENGKGYDEDKVMLGFGSKKDATEAFLKHYDDPKFLGPVKTVPVEKLKELIAKKKQLKKIAAGAGTRGGFLMSSEVPAFRAPTLKSPIQTQPQQIVEKLGGVPTTPAGLLASSKRVGAPRVTTPPGPSIAQVSKPVGYGKPAAGAAKGTL